MASTCKIALWAVIAATSLSYVPHTLAQSPSCAQERAVVAENERQVREWEEYVARGGPGYTTMGPLIQQLKGELASARDTYQRCTSSEGSPGTSATGGGVSDSPQRNPDDDNPWKRGEDDPNNPFAQSPGVDPNNPFGAPRGQSGQDNGSGQGQGSSGQGSGGSTQNGSKEPPRDFDGKPCVYFTKPVDPTRMNSYKNGTFICFQERMYECIEGYWAARAPCWSYDKSRVRRAEDLESSKINTRIYEEE